MPTMVYSQSAYHVHLFTTSILYNKVRARVIPCYYYCLVVDNLSQCFYSSLGSYFSIFDINPLRVTIENKKLVLILFIIFAVGDFYSHTVIGTPINLQLHRISLILNIPVLLLLADWCVRHEFTSKLLPNSAFIVFCLHYPFVVLLRRICISKFSDSSDYIHILLYFACVIVATVLSIGFYYLLERFFPKVKNVLSGNR